MQSPRQDASPSDSLATLPAAASSVRLNKRQPVLEGHPLSESQASLPYRRANPSAATLFASTQTPPGSRSMSPVGGRAGSPGINSPGSVYGGAASKSLLDAAADSPGDPLNLLLKSYVPHIAIYTSQDTAEFAKEKGFSNGLWELLRPFGERIQGKVSIRDSNGSSRAWEDFSVRFVELGSNIEAPEIAASGSKNPASVANGISKNNAKERKRLEDVEAVVERHLRYAEDSIQGMPHHGHLTRQGLDIEATSPYYSLYIRRLLSGIPVSAHETFAHPVACVIAISSRSKNPIDELRQLYNETRTGNKSVPGWVDGEYLRYYVLVHDEERDDITRSITLFEQMKRHLGLHCHLLRLRSSQSAETDDDSIPLPRSDWMTAEEELADIHRSDLEEDFEDPTRHIFESDATAIRTFIREMVTQSIIPTMERHVSVWNDQVASRRRGIAGRFMNLSRKWGGFGGSRSSTGSASGGADTYEALGYYKPETSEAIMRKLADFAFMLRDFKLAHSTYDLLRSDFHDAKAWRYHAATNEMAALSLLIMPQTMSSKSRTEALDQMLDAALYSYNTRCSSPFGALRALTLGLELLRLRGGSAVDDAAKWGIRLLDSKTLGPIGDGLMKERLAVCYASKEGVGSGGWGSRTRKAAVWAVLGAEAWLLQSKSIQAQRCLNEAQRLYSDLPSQNGVSKFALANDFMLGLQAHLDQELEPATGGEGGDDQGSDEADLLVDEETEALGEEAGARAKRASVVVRPGAMFALETAPLHEAATSPPADKDNRESSVQDDFG
ncbi:ER-golgi trafficking TRAPP I complex 85 kDa subunit-domain-containing protein [Plectosphaerella cucumerina]|uniref:ER-golgi trafficking TRAPP I complex 85 kDa subunit-domain-containing protein n=1 Tax=Plectosphaerella cucumerina TaxID=40658 RepID=A0A8K0TTD8_9PEZI|nr:ER-golgi trafficking TRAPP I complex 85 kDa subunit-domain-containing protein [Plectosphaerella cucumerina]